MIDFDKNAFESEQKTGHTLIKYNGEKIYGKGEGVPTDEEMKHVFDYSAGYIADATTTMTEVAIAAFKKDKDTDRVKVVVPFGRGDRGKIEGTFDRDVPPSRFSKDKESGPAVRFKVHHTDLSPKASTLKDIKADLRNQLK